MHRNTIVLSIDGLNAGFLGPYGNSWVETPAINQLASESMLVEYATTDSSDVAATMASFWTGRHAAAYSTGDGVSLASLAKSHDVDAVLVTDCDVAARHPAAVEFEVLRIHSSSDIDPTREPAIEDSRIAELLAVAAGRLADLSEPFVLWVHARGMYGAWDSPRSMREIYRDDDDPEPFAGVIPPALKLPAEHDPDEVLKYVHAYAAEAAMFDVCVGAFYDYFLRLGLGDDTLLTLTASRGFSLGGANEIGLCRAFHNDWQHIPFIVRAPHQPATRRALLAQPADLFATVCDWMGFDAPSYAPAFRLLDAACDVRTRPWAASRSDDLLSLRTPGWLLNELGQGSDNGWALFVKPDDRHDINDVAALCPDEVDELRAFLYSIQTPFQGEPPHLQDHLVAPER